MRRVLFSCLGEDDREVGECMHACECVLQKT